jgi:hypothetical protein
MFKKYGFRLVTRPSQQNIALNLTEAVFVGVLFPRYQGYVSINLDMTQFPSAGNNLGTKCVLSGLTPDGTYSSPFFISAQSTPRPR